MATRGLVLARSILISFDQDLHTYKISSFLIINFFRLKHLPETVKDTNVLVFNHHLGVPSEVNYNDMVVCSFIFLCTSQLMAL